jgi:hypothetical protein
LVKLNERKSKDLEIAEAQVISATNKAVFFKEQLDEERQIVEDLTKSNRNLKLALGIQTGIGVIAIGSLVYLTLLAR